MHPARIVIALATLTAAGALFLPFLDLPIQGSINGVDGDAWPAVAVLAVPTLMALLGDRAEGFSTPAALVATFLASGAVVFSAFKVADSLEAADLGSGSVGPGSWILLIAAAIALVGCSASFTKRLS